MAEKDVELFVEGICCEDGDDCVESDGSDNGSEAEHCGERWSSNQWPQSYSIDSSTTAAFPSFGWLRGTSSRYSSLDLGSQSGHDLNLKQPLLSGSIIEKNGLDKNFKKMISLTGDKAISCHAQIHGELASHGCSVTQTVFNDCHIRGIICDLSRDLQLCLVLLFFYRHCVWNLLYWKVTILQGCFLVFLLIGAAFTWILCTSLDF